MSAYKCALSFLVSREHHLAEMMEDFLQDANDDLMDSWFVDSLDLSSYFSFDCMDHLLTSILDAPFRVPQKSMCGRVTP